MNEIILEQILDTLNRLASSTNPEIRTIAHTITQVVTHLDNPQTDTAPVDLAPQDETPPVE